MDSLSYDALSLFVDVLKWSLTVALFVSLYGLFYFLVLAYEGRKILRQQAQEAQMGHPDLTDS